MSEMYFTDFNPINPVEALSQNDRTFDVRDEKWGHPLLVGLDKPWDMSALGASWNMYNPAIPMEAKRQIQQEGKAAMVALFNDPTVEHTCDVQEFEVPGCPEEPDTPVKLEVYRPKTLKGTASRVLFYIMGGALVMAEPPMFPIEDQTCRYDCVTVVTRHRLSIDAPYPAAVNDLHAAYTWLLANGETVDADVDNIVIHGMSSGAQLSLALGFRLKRYGICPKGIVAMAPQTDDREKGTLASMIFNGSWDGLNQHDALMQWLGINFASDRIGPEALANHATVKDCIGYPPTFIHTFEFDPDRDNCREFVGKLLEAKTFAEFHMWGGAHHASAAFDGVAMLGELNEYSKRCRVIFDGNMEDLWNYDLRRPWVLDE